MPLRLHERAAILGRVVARPSHARLLLRDALGLEEPLLPDEAHLAAALAWLCRAHDRAGGRGLSAGYSYKRGWLPPYPETTGYTIPTFLRAAARTGCGELVDRARRMGDWEMEIQLPDGGVRGGMGVGGEPVVFNTGQVMLGWLALHRHTGHQPYLDAAIRAGDWLVSVQDGDGRWTRHTYRGVPHAYHTRVAWPLLLLEERAPTGRYGRAAAALVEWVLAGARPNGWVPEMAFHPSELPFTHTIAYTYRGLLESAPHLGGQLGQRAEDTAARAAEHLLRRFELEKADPEAPPRPLPAVLGPDWRGRSRYSCLTGSAQIALVWMRLYQRRGDGRLLNGALKLLDQVKARQALATGNPDLRGAVPGSFPLWGWYLRLAFPNWAAKFLADALLLQEALLAELEPPP